MIGFCVCLINHLGRKFPGPGQFRPSELQHISPELLHAVLTGEALGPSASPAVGAQGSSSSSGGLSQLLFGRVLTPELLRRRNSFRSAVYKWATGREKEEFKLVALEDSILQSN